MKWKQTSVRLAMAALAFTATLTAGAEAYVKVTGADGKAVTFRVEDHPKVSFTAEALVITTDAATVDYPLSDYRRFEFSDEATAVASVESSVKEPTFTIGNSLTAEGLEPGSQVIVYSAGGQLIGSAKADLSGNASVSLQGLNGVGIVKTQAKTFKFIKK